MITGTNESKTLVKHISCNGRCKFDGRKCNSKQNWNNDKCQRKCKKQLNTVYRKRIMLGILAYVLVRVTKIVRLMNI